MTDVNVFALTAVLVLCKLQGLPGSTATWPQSRRKHNSSPADSNNPLKPNASRFEKEIHLYLGARSMVNCMLHSRMNDFFPYIVYSVYKEVMALDGRVTEVPISNDLVKRVRDHCQLSHQKPGCRRGTDTRVCALALRVPTGMQVAVEVVENAGYHVMVHEGRRYYRVDGAFNTHTDKLARTQLFVSFSNVLNVTQIETREDEVDDVDRPPSSRFVFRFWAVENSGLNVIQSEFNKGVMQTYRYHDQTDFRIPLLQDFAYVYVPFGHIIMLSSTRINLIYQPVVLYGGDNSNEELLRLYDNDRLHKSRVYLYRTTLLTIHVFLQLTQVYHISNYGFQFLFSFHNQSAVPEKLPDNTWNCSVPYKADFLFHLSCNVEVECHDAEDELGCPHTSDLCGPGYLALGRSCFSYLRGREKKLTWHAASRLCRKQGGRLASLSTKEKWTQVMTWLASTPFHRVVFHVGLRSSSFNLPRWYRGIFQWVDTTIAYDLHYTKKTYSRICGISCGRFFFVLDSNPPRSMLDLEGTDYCLHEEKAFAICEKPTPSHTTSTSFLSNITQNWQSDPGYVSCPLGHYTHHFLACDKASSCWFDHRLSYCESSLTSFPFYACASDVQLVPYDMVCNHRADCFDRSDEDFCSFPLCQREEFTCYNGQCVPPEKLCNHWEDCQQGEDENTCSYGGSKSMTSFPPPAVINVDSNGLLEITPNVSLAAQPNACPNTHFQCFDNGYCLPVFLRCNGVYDCPGHEDETDCNTCPGFYRCRDSEVCLLYSDLCDGHSQCPQHDDELLCHSICPPDCVCRGLAFSCSRVFTASAYPSLRYLDAKGTTMTPGNLRGNLLLIHLVLTNCGLTHLDNITLPNLISLDIKNNQLSIISYLHLVGVPQLRQLSVAGNPLMYVFNGTEEISSFHNLQSLDLSRVVMPDFNAAALSAFPKLRVLNLSNSGVQRVQGEGFRNMEELRVLDLAGCPMKWFPFEIFYGLELLHTVHVGTFKACCPTVLPPNFNIHNCFAPKEFVSSCENLLRGNPYRVCVFVLSLFAMIGNFVSFVYRICVIKREKLGYGNFVTHLSVSDFCMGVYLAIIGIADQVYHGIYLSNDYAWKHSVICKLGGFLALVSSEVSALIVCLITVDRFLVLCFPFRELHFSPMSAHTASAMVWICCVTLALVPLLPVTSHWEFYGQTGICIPLPIIMNNFVGQDYSFGILIVFNFIVFVFISIGQLAIYWSVRVNAMSVSNTTKKTRDLSIARRLITVAMTDFLCWFPIGVLGLLASNGVPIPGEVNVVCAMFLLPLNSAVNPCIYTVNVILERRRRAREMKLRSAALAQLKLSAEGRGNASHERNKAAA